MKYDFDTLIERRGTGALKHDALQQRYGNPNLTPLWVADMDFATPPFIVEALKQRIEHPVFGYTIEPADYRPAIIDWLRDRHGWEVEPDWLSYIPGIVKGIGFAIKAFVKPGEKVIIQPPVYHPFRLTPLANDREVVYNPLHENPDGSYSMDFDNLAQVADDKCRMLLLSNPHNPAGIVWDRDTLSQLAQFCAERNILVISDEIHCDMALWGLKHTPFATVSPEAAANSITFGAPTKTFNIAGIVSSFAVVPNPQIRERFYSWLEANELNEPNIFAPIATIAAFRHGDEWRRQMLAYIEGNIEAVEQRVKRDMPRLKVLRPQASFLVWLDCRALGLSHQQLLTLFEDGAGLALNDGETFNPGGQGFMRLNVASPRSVINDAMDRLKSAIDKL